MTLLLKPFVVSAALLMTGCATSGQYGTLTVSSTDGYYREVNGQTYWAEENPADRVARNQRERGASDLNARDDNIWDRERAARDWAWAGREEPESADAGDEENPTIEEESLDPKISDEPMDPRDIENIMRDRYPFGEPNSEERGIAKLPVSPSPVPAFPRVGRAWVLISSPGAESFWLPVFPPYPAS